MKVRFSEAATLELRDAKDYYAAESEGLAQMFEAEVIGAIKRIVQFPEGWSLETGREFRKCLLNKFPYKIIYSIEKDYVLILAVAHQHRRPDYWVER